MEMKQVKSSNINKIGIDKSTQKLRVQFRNGTMYEYDAVPEPVLNGLENAENSGISIGSYLHKNVFRKDVNIAYRKLTDEEQIQPNTSLSVEETQS